MRTHFVFNAQSTRRSDEGEAKFVPESQAGVSFILLKHTTFVSKGIRNKKKQQPEKQK